MCHAKDNKKSLVTETRWCHTVRGRQEIDSIATVSGSQHCLLLSTSHSMTLFCLCFCIFFTVSGKANTNLGSLGVREVAEREAEWKMVTQVMSDCISGGDRLKSMWMHLIKNSPAITHQTILEHTKEIKVKLNNSLTEMRTNKHLSL